MPGHFSITEPSRCDILADIEMAQIRGTAGYNLGGNPSPFGNSNSSAAADPSPLDQIREQTSKIEDILDTWSEPVKP